MAYSGRHRILYVSGTEQGISKGQKCGAVVVVRIIFPFLCFPFFFFFLEINKKDILGLKQSCKFKTTSLHDEYSVTY